jgi:hypothetical protein
LEKIDSLDKEAELRGLDASHWQARYDLEAALETIYCHEEHHFKQLSGIKWTLKGDSNNRFFHGAANGRRKKCSIFFLEEEGVEIRDPWQIRTHVENYYKNLFGAEERGGISLGESFWDVSRTLTNDEADDLTKPFTIEEIEGALKDMDCSSAPGPDGLPVGFYRAFWTEIKPLMIEMFNNFHRGDFNLRRLNYGMISLIPKLKDASNIRQFRPICVLNIDYKWFTKVLTTRLTPLADKLISKSQTAFIPGRFILEGVVILHEILHDLRVTKTRGIVLKLDFEKAYDKVN